jgi:hypothetical protein
MTIYHDPIQQPKLTGCRVVITELELQTACRRVWGPRAWVAYSLRLLLINLGIEVRSW